MKLQIGDKISCNISGVMYRHYEVVRCTKTQAIAECRDKGREHTVRFRINTYMGGMVDRVGGQSRNVFYVLEKP